MIGNDDAGDDGGEIVVGGGADGGAAAADAGAAAADGGKAAAKPAKLGWKEALAQVREAIGATKGATDPARAAIDGAAAAGDDDGAAGTDDQGETAEELEARLAALSPDDRAAEEERMAAELADDPLIVDLGAMREGEEPIRIQAADQAMADHIRALKNRGQTYEASLKIRDEAEGYRAQADEMRFAVRLDPAGFLLENLAGPQGQLRTGEAVHVARSLLTQAGVLDAKISADGTTLKDWILALAEHPEALPQEARLMNAERLERVEKTKPMVERLKFENQNARALVRRAYSAVDEMVPETWTQEQRDRFVADITRDLQETQQQEKVSVTDPRRVPGFVERRLAAFGVAPKKAKSGPAGAGAGRPGAKTPGRTGPSGQQLRATDDARRRAAGPGPGAGSPAAQMPKPPAGTKLTGKGNVFDFVRQHIPALRRAPR